MEHITNAKMVAYDQVKEMANISYLTPKGAMNNLWIHRMTFEMLMSNKWEKEVEQYGEPSIFHRDMRDAIRQQIKGDYMEWFDTHANDLQRQYAMGTLR